MPNKNKDINLTSEDSKNLYYNMYLVRRFEEKCAQLYSMGLIAGFLHLYIGQEAVASGFNFLKKPQDTHITAYRCHGHALLQGGIEPKLVMAELLGKATGSSKGKGGSMHLYSKENGFFGGNGIVGAQVSLGAGLALSHKRKNDGGINISYMGDGAFPQGQVYETLNMAALFELPSLFVIENNLYSMGTPLERTYSNLDLYNRGPVFNVPSALISDGMNVMEVMREAKKAIDYVRENQKPFLLEVKTYRYRGHSMSDPQKYRNKEEVNSFRNDNDPILNFEKHCLKNNLLSAEDFKSIQSHVKKIVLEAEEFAISSPEPESSELYKDVLI